MIRKIRKMLFLPLMTMIVLASVPIVALGAPPASKTVQAHGKITEIYVAFSWMYIGSFDPSYPFLNRVPAGGPWQVTAQPETDKAEFNVAVKTTEGIIKFSLVRVDNVEIVGSILTIEGAIKERYKGHSYTWDVAGTKITVDLIGNTLDLDLSNDDDNLLGTVKSGSPHP